MCLVAGGERGIIFEDFTTIAYGVQVGWLILLFQRSIKMNLKKYSIVGAGSIIMPGVTLAEGTSVGALVLKSTEPWGIYIGNPARRFKERFIRTWKRIFKKWRKIPFNKPPFTGNEEKYVIESMRSNKISGDGEYTKKCHKWFEEKLHF